MLQRLVPALQGQGVESSVCSLTGVGKVGETLVTKGIQVYSVDMRRMPLTAIGKIRKLVKQDRADLVHTWLYHADLLGGIAARSTSGVALVWSLRNSRLNFKVSTRIVVKLCALLSSRMPDAIVACAQSAKDEHVSRGYPADCIRVIPNGFDTTSYFPDKAKGLSMREQFRIDDNVVVFGLVGRYDPHKDHSGYIEAAAKYIRDAGKTGTKFVFCGEEMDQNNQHVVEKIRTLGLTDDVLLLGAREDMQDVYQAFDVLVSSSISEGFSNVVGEAMCCAKPCIVTDVGDSRVLIGDTGVVVPPGDPDRMAAALSDMVRMGAGPRQKMGELGRKRIHDNYTLERVAVEYADLYRTVTH